MEVFHSATRRFFFLVLFCLLHPVYSKPFFNITASSNPIQVEAGNIVDVSFQVTNSSGILARNIVYDVNYPGKSNITIGSGTTCGSTLQAFQSCILKLRFFAGNTPGSFLLSPRICADNGIVCSIPDCANRVLVQVVAVPLTLEVDTNVNDQHLQARALILTNTGSTAVHLNSIHVMESSSVQNQVEICNASTGCTPPAGSQPSCDSLSSLAGGSSCLIWFLSLDLAAQPLGSLSGTLRIAINTVPATTLNQNIFPVTYNNNLYAGGSFISAGGVAQTNRIAAWNGTTWQALSTGISNGAARTLLIAQFDLFIGGSFTNIGGVNGDRIVRWNGINFNALSTGIATGAVNTLQFFNNRLYLGGTFTNVGGVDGDRVVSWNGTTFNALSTGIGNNTVSASFVFDNELIFGGSFIDVGSVNGDRIVSWNEVAFNALSLGIGNGAVQALLSINNLLYVGGTFTNQYGALGDRILSWDGTTFSPLSLITAPNNSVLGLASFNNQLILAGSFTNLGSASGDRIAAWDGSNYNALDSGIGNGNVNALAVAQNSLLFVAGSFTLPTIRIAQWDGLTWSALGTGIDNTVNTLLVGSSLIL